MSASATDAAPLERELRFGEEDMRRFARASGDHSPLHTDPAFARRTAFGAPIVYGGLLTIGMLGLLPAGDQSRIRSVRSLFPGPVLPGEATTASASLHPTRPGEWEVRLSGRGKLLARLQASADAFAGSGHAEALADGTDAGGGPDVDGAYRGLQRDDLDELARRFGAHHLAPAVLDGIAWASNVVGTVLPAAIAGFHGLCAGVTAIAGAGGAPRDQRIAIRERDQRSGRILVDGALVDAAGVPRCLGVIECFPFSPTPLTDMPALAAGGPLAERAGVAAVVGASRGLGAALALALLGRGYAVHAIYERSAPAAEQVRRLAGPYAERLTLHAADAADAAAMSALAGAVQGPLDGIALCAAEPPLPMGLTARSARELSAFVARAVDLAAVPLGALAPLLRRDGAWALVCSAPAAVEPTRDLPQLAAAKSAVEGLARWLAATTPGLRVLVARPPRMRTDLANTPSARRLARAPEEIAAALARQLLDEEPPPPPGLVFADLEPAAPQALVP